MKHNLLFFILILISNYSFSQILPSNHAVHHKADGIIEDNLILHLDASNTSSLNQNDLSTWNDLSSSNNDISLVTGFTRNSYTLNSDPSFSSDNGGSIIFNDDAAYRKSTFSNFSGNAFTVSMWIKTSQTSGRLFSVARSPSSYGKQMILWLTSSKVGIYGASNSMNTVNDNTWKFITIVRNSGTYKYYINNSLDVTKTGQDSKTFNSNDLVIGWDYRNNNSGFEGNLGAVFFYNTDLTTDQVVNNYNTTKSRYGH
ncbi:MAG: LamG-like jellyroll fold domain-containing protein [Bacteroidota bacterium]|nr:LamG-like jellyroll fold domain-containing protein [Bacteroidota bacterium]|tara:strand:- start:2451 stop:3218 length:768 start_codon:yes stop_codon:yes gene_type:complete